MRRDLSLQQRIERLQGPILILGGSGFIGANRAANLLAAPGRCLRNRLTTACVATGRSTGPQREGH